MSMLFKKPDPIKVADPVRMPTEDDVSVRAAKDRKQRQISGRSGRSSTMMSRRGGSAGTNSYGNSLLGQAG